MSVMTGYRNPYQRYYDEYLGINNKRGINWVQGLEGAKSYNDIKPKETVLLMDSEDDRLFIKSCDEIGKPSIRIFRLTEEFEKPKEVTKENNSNIDMSDYVKRDEIQNIIFDMIGGLNNVKEQSGEFVQSVDATEQQHPIQTEVNKPKLKF